MGLTSDIQSEIGIALDTDLADAAISISIIQVNGTYDVDSGLNTLSETSYSTRGVFLEQFSKEDFQAEIKPGDKKVLILQNELSIEPQIDDRLLYNSLEYKIIAKMADPANVTWELLCRI